MKFIRGFKYSNILKNWVFWLILITIFAIILRSIPGWVNAAWGADFGIYYGITKTVVETRAVFPPYSGWGSSYNEFPVLYMVNAFAQWVTGIDIFIIMPKLTPIFGGLSILIFYFFIYELIKDKKIALLSALFLAVLPFHVYQTSHASPLTMGHFFMILSMYLFLKYRKNTKYTIPLLISTLLLIMSHHLTTYFYIIILIFIIFIENIKSKNWTETFKKDIYYIITSSAMIFSYWALIAKTVYQDFMGSGIPLGIIRLEAIHIIILFYILFFTMFWFIKLIRRHNLFIEKIKLKIRRFSIEILSTTKAIIPTLKTNEKPKKIGSVLWFKSKNQSNYYIFKFLLMLLGILSIMILFLFIKIPWTNFTFTIETIFYSFPLLITVSLAVAGFGYVFKQKKGLLICGWFLAVLISLFFALVTDNHAILPDRHIEYIMAPIAVLAVYGLGGIFSDPNYKKLLSNLTIKKTQSFSRLFRWIKISKTVRFAFSFIVIILVLSLASTVYVSYSSLNVAVEEITNEDANVVKWMFENLDKKNSMIASDHRLARLTESYGFNTTKDETIELWEAEELDEYIDELIGIGKNHSRITHIILDDKMKNDVVHVYFGIIKYMTNETWTAAYDKFKKQPFELIYRNESKEINALTNESLRWAELYEVNWTYIEEKYLPEIN
jgi:hypothetical protein